jgi:hypothetical protein
MHIDCLLFNTNSNSFNTSHHKYSHLLSLAAEGGESTALPPDIAELFERSIALPPDIAELFEDLGWRFDVRVNEKHFENYEGNNSDEPDDAFSDASSNFSISSGTSSFI